jgi:nucleoside-diphosphate-sugar epimerase
MHVVVVGATGNVGTSLLPALADDGEVDSILGIARRRPDLAFPKTEWAQADIADDELTSLFRAADAVVHLAWQIQPSHDFARLRRTNVEGSARLFQAVATANVPALVYASSVGAYSAGPKDRLVDESWPTNGIGTSFYARHKAEVERLLDRFERESPTTRVVRLRPGLIFKRQAAAGIRRLFAGPFLVNTLLHPKLIPVIPDLPNLRFQAVHSHDAAEAYRLAVTNEVRGAFNIAAEPVLGPKELGRILDARPVRVPARAARFVVALTWRLHLQPTPPGWLDLALGVPLLDTARARQELGWTPRHGADDALLDLLVGLREGAGLETPPLKAETSRAEEVRTGVGESERR